VFICGQDINKPQMNTDGAAPMARPEVSASLNSSLHAKRRRAP